jgi:hypothetical protein
MDEKQSIVREAVSGKATAGIPTLDAMKRYLKSRHDFQTMKTEQQVRDAETGKASLFAKDGELDPTNEAQMKGRVYTAAQVMKKLQKLNPRFYFERSIAMPHLIGIYIQHPRGEYKNGLMFLMGMPDGDVTQYSVRKPDESGKRMLIEKRGWMKLLLDLAKMGAINLEEARRKFHAHDHQSKNFSILTGARNE